MISSIWYPTLKYTQVILTAGILQCHCTLVFGLGQQILFHVFSDKQKMLITLVCVESRIYPLARKYNLDMKYDCLTLIVAATYTLKTMTLSQICFGYLAIYLKYTLYGHGVKTKCLCLGLQQVSSQNKY